MGHPRTLAWALAPFVTGAVLLGGALLGERVLVERRRGEESARVAAREAVIARGALGETLVLCGEGWKNELALHHEPVAVAFTRQGIDAYFFQGTDGNSLRQVRCDASGVSFGPRVAHPLAAQLPAEAPAETVAGSGAEWHAALNDAAGHTLAADELALELVMHPVTRAVFRRLWRAGGEAALATVQPEGAPPFSLLVASPAFPRSKEAPPPPEPLARRRWIAEPEAAFALLAGALPKGARVSELSLGEERIEVQVDHPTRAFDGNPDAPYGDMEWDEYGVADSTWWYPREIPGFGCARGETLERVRASFEAARARRGERPIDRAWYTCSTAYSDGRTGVWHMMPQ
jgi:hypothetical protein